MLEKLADRSSLHYSVIPKALLSVIVIVGFWPTPVKALQSPSSEVKIGCAILETSNLADMAGLLVCSQPQEKLALQPVPPVVVESINEKTSTITISQKPAVKPVSALQGTATRALPSSLPSNSASGDQTGDAIRLYADSSSKFGSCVPFAKAQTGISHTLGNGARASIQGHEPRVGAIGALAGKVPHAVVITSINGNQITFKESGYERGYITQRTLPTSMFLGYVYN